MSFNCAFRSRQPMFGFLGFVSAAVLATAPGLGAERDPADLIPSDAKVFLGWSHISEPECNWTGLMEAFFASPMLLDAGNGELEAIRSVLPAIDLAARHTGAIGFQLPDDSDGTGDLYGIVQAGPDAMKLAEAFEKILSALDRAESRPRNVAGAALRETQMENGRALIWGAHHELFVAASSEACLTKLLAVAEGKGESLAASTSMRKCREKAMSTANASWNVTVFAETRPFLNLIEEIEPNAPVAFSDLWRALGVSEWGGAYLRLEPHEYGTRMVMYLQTGASSRGLNKLYRQKPLSDKDLAIIPKDAYWASVWNLDLSELWKETRNTIEEIAPDAGPMIDGGIATTAQLLAFSITEDFLPALGSRWALFDAPSHGGILFTGTTLVVDAKNSKALHDILARLVEIGTPFAAKADLKLELRQMKHGEHTIHYLLFGGLPVPIAPAWGFVENRCVFALFPQTVATAMQQIDPKTQGPSLLDNEQYQAARKHMPVDVTSISYYDLRYSYRFCYGLMHLLRTAIAAMTAGSSNAYDLAAAPTFPEEMKHVRNLLTTHSYDEGGVMYTALGSSPVWVLLGGDISSALAISSMTASFALPSFSQARMSSKRAISAAHLRMIWQACHVYASTHGDRFPASFEALIEEGALTREQLNSPLQPDRPDAYVLIRHAKAISDPQQVLAYENPASDEGTNVCFTDGRVEWLSMPDFRRVLRETHQRLGREDEIPQEYRETSP